MNELQKADAAEVLNARKFREFVDDLNRLEMESAQLLALGARVRRQAKDFGWELSKLEGDQ